MSINSKFLFEKEGFEFIKNDNNNYSLSFELCNKNIYFRNVIDFGLIKLVFDLNPDIFEKVTMEKINENEVTIAVLTNNAFEDLGIMQEYVYLNTIKNNNHSSLITFRSTPINNKYPSDFPPNVCQLPINYINCDCKILNMNTINFTFNINLIGNPQFPIEFAEKMLGNILFKMFKRVKQFIENITV